MRTLAAAVAALSLAASPPPGFVREPSTGVTIAARVGDRSLLGVGVHRKTFLRIEVYAIGLYVAHSALSGAGDFEKQIVLKLVRGLSAEQIQGAFREQLLSVDRRLLSQFVSYFARASAGQECVLHWAPGGILETKVAGVAKPAIADRVFSRAVLAIWLDDRPLDDDIKERLVSRAMELLE